MDLDDFKKINDTYGHPTGDRVLGELAEFLLASVRDVDIVARYGGEEFAILLPMTNIRQAKLVCERIRRGIAERVFDNHKNNIKVTVSMGMASLRAHAPTSSLHIVEMADQALYAAKRNGKNRSYIYVANGENNDNTQAELERTLTLVT